MKRFLLALTALTLIATGCNKKNQPAGEPAGEPLVNNLSIIGAPELAVLVGEKFSLTVKSDVDVQTVEWNSSDPAVAKVNTSGCVLATGKGTCDISASVGKSSAKVSVSVNDRDPDKDEMGHVGASKMTYGMNNATYSFSIGNTPWTGAIWYQGGTNTLTYYANGTFKASWNATNNCMVRLLWSVRHQFGNHAI